jgi:hypothetical protein
VRTAFRLVAINNQFSGAFALLGSDYIFAYGDGAGTIQAARFVAGGGPPMPVTIASMVNGGAGTVRSVELANNRVYIFNDVGPDGANGNASAGYYVVDEALTAPGPLVSLGSGAAGKAAFDIASDSALGNFQVAAVDLDLANGTPPAVLHAGPVPSAKATSFNVLDMPSAYTFNTILDAPFGDHRSARFEGNNFFALGPNPNKDPGLDFLWFDTKQKVLRAFNGSADKLLPARTTTSVAAVLTQSTAIFANFDVVWTENATQNPMSTVPAQLFAGQMSCLK